MTANQTVEERAAELLRLRNKIDDELIRLARTIDTSKRRSKFDIPACGTESAYQRHRYQGEKCDECRAAHAAHEKAARAIRMLRKVAA